MQTRVYRCKCHVCGKEYDYEAYLLSSPLSAMADDGKTELPVRACNTHTGAEIRAAYEASRG